MILTAFRCWMMWDLSKGGIVSPASWVSKPLPLELLAVDARVGFLRLTYDADSGSQLGDLILLSISRQDHLHGTCLNAGRGGFVGKDMVRYMRPSNTFPSPRTSGYPALNAGAAP